MTVPVVLVIITTHQTPIEQFNSGSCPFPLTFKYFPQTRILEDPEQSLHAIPQQYKTMDKVIHL
jgi:hypothetical protein